MLLIEHLLPWTQSVDSLQYPLYWQSFRGPVGVKVMGREVGAIVFFALGIVDGFAVGFDVKASV